MYSSPSYSLLRLCLCERTTPFSSSNGTSTHLTYLFSASPSGSSQTSCLIGSHPWVPRLCSLPLLCFHSTATIKVLSLTLLAHITPQWRCTFLAEPGFTLESFWSHSRQPLLINWSWQSRWNLPASPNFGARSTHNTFYVVLEWFMNLFYTSLQSPLGELLSFLIFKIPLTMAQCLILVFT